MLNCLLQSAWLCVEDAGLHPEWQRVCSSAKVADAVSRFDFSFAEQEGWERVRVNWEKIFRDLLELCWAGPLRQRKGS